MSDEHELRKVLIISAENLVFAYPGGQPVLDNVSIHLHAGECTGLCGGNGSGKTTLLRCLTGLLKPQSGRILLRSKEMKKDADFYELRREVGLVLQNSDDQLLFPTVQEDLAFGPLNLGLSRAEAGERVATALALTGLEGFENRYTHKLSGGEKKLVAIASILAMQPKALLLDEPLNGLDEHAAAKIVDLLKKLDCAKIVISHDNAMLDRICTNRMVLKNGHLSSAS